jgi:hypothetical protein
MAHLFYSWQLNYVFTLHVGLKLSSPSSCFDTLPHIHILSILSTHTIVNQKYNYITKKEQMWESRVSAMQINTSVSQDPMPYAPVNRYQSFIKARCSIFKEDEWSKPYKMETKGPWWNTDNLPNYTASHPAFSYSPLLETHTIYHTGHDCKITSLIDLQYQL